jgi:PIN domain nuclease of toxin-antitoxin system
VYDDKVWQSSDIPAWEKTLPNPGPSNAQLDYQANKTPDQIKAALMNANVTPEDAAAIAADANNGDPAAKGKLAKLIAGTGLTMGDLLQIGGNMVSPTFNLLTGLLNPADKEPEIKNKYAKNDLANLKNLKIRPDLNPLLGQVNAIKASVNANSTGSQRLASLLGLQNQTGTQLGSVDVNTANANAQLLQQALGQELMQGERDRAESIRAKGTTDMNKAARFEFFSKAAEQFGPAIGSAGSALNNSKRNMTMFNLMKEIMPDFTLPEFNEWLRTNGQQGIKFKGSLPGKTTTTSTIPN